MAATTDQGDRTNGRVARAGLRMRYHHEGDRHVVELDGELDLGWAEALRAELKRCQLSGPLTVIDLHRLTFIDSTGLGVLFDAFERAQASGRRVVFTRSSPEVERVLHLTGLDRVLPTVPGERFDGDSPAEYAENA